MRPTRILPLLLSALPLLSACNAHFQSTPTPAARQTILRGNFHGGQQPISGVTVQLYALDSSGNGVAPYALLASPVLTAADGSFDLTGQFVCPTQTSALYLLGTGGNPGLAAGTNNTQLALGAYLGTCSQFTPANFVSVNEVTTVALAFGFAPFAASASNISMPGSIAQPSFANAQLLAAYLADPSTGLASGPTVPAGTTVPVAQVNTIANILATCVNSAGGTTSDTPCGSLFALTHSASGAVPSDSFMALVNLANNPAANTPTLYALPAGAAPFQPSDTAQPADLSIPLAAPALTLSLSPAAGIVFPSTAVGTAATPITATLTNMGTATWQGSASTIAGQSDFTATGGCLQLSPGASCNFSIAFTPQVSGPRNANFVIATSNGLNTVLPLAGTAAGTVVPPFISTGAKSLSFSAQIGIGSAQQNVSFYNTGGLATNINLVVSGPGAADITLTSNTCTGSLKPNAACYVSVGANPYLYGTTHPTLYLDVGGMGPAVSIPITDTATGTQGTLTVTPASFTFPNTITNTTSETTGITLTGTNGYVYYSYAIGGPNASDFSVPTACSGYNFLNNGNCPATVDFKPTGLGLRTATLYFYNDGTKGTQAVALSGTGVVPPVVTFTPLAFPSTIVGTQSASQNFVLTNTSTTTAAPITFYSTSNSDFTFPNIFPASCPSLIPPGGTCTIPVIFSPTVSGTRTDTLTVMVGGYSSSFNYTVTGTGSTDGPLTVTGSGFLTDFVSATANINNTGSTPIPVNSLTLNGAAFSQYNNCGTSIAAHNSCSITFSSSCVTGFDQRASLTMDTGQGILTVSVGNLFSKITCLSGAQVGVASTYRLTLPYTGIGGGHNGTSVNSITGTNPSDFYASAPSCTDYTCPIYIYFKPTTTGLRSATINATTGTFNVQGTGTP